jgi:hypothetical protein
MYGNVGARRLSCITAPQLRAAGTLPALFMNASAAAIADSRLRQTCAPASRVQVGGLATRPLDVLFQVRLGLSRLHAPVSRRDSAVSRRTVMNKAG